MLFAAEKKAEKEMTNAECLNDEGIDEARRINTFRASPFVHSFVILISSVVILPASSCKP